MNGEILFLWDPTQPLVMAGQLSGSSDGDGGRKDEEKKNFQHDPQILVKVSN